MTTTVSGKPDVRRVLADFDGWCWKLASSFSRAKTEYSAEDLHQEAQVAIWRALEKYDPTKRENDNIALWVTSAARNRLMAICYGDGRLMSSERTWTHRGKAQEIAVDTQPDDTPGSDRRMALFGTSFIPSGADLSAHADEILAAILDLPEKQRYVIYQTFYHGWNNGDFKREFGYFPGALKTAGLKKLREKLSHLETAWN